MRLILGRLLAAIPTLISVIVVTFVARPDAAGRPGRLFRRARRDAGLDRGDARHASASTAASSSSSSPMSATSRRGDLGNSLTSGQPVLDDIRNRLPASLELTFGALLLAALIGLPLGVGAALRPGGAVDRICSLVSTIGQAVPTFFLGLLLVFVFYYLLDWAPAPLGRLDIVWSSPDEITGFWSIDALLAGDCRAVRRGRSRQLVLPVTTLALFGIGPLARTARAGMIEVLASRLRAHRARRRPVAAEGAVDLRLPERARCRCSTAPAWCSPSCSARACWSRRSSAGRASAPTPSTRCSPPTSPRSRASCSRWRSST